MQYSLVKPDSNGEKTIFNWNDVKDEFIPFFNQMDDDYELGYLGIIGKVGKCGLEKLEITEEFAKRNLNVFTKEEIINDNITNDLGNDISSIIFRIVEK
jgi:hypothetical protein